MGKVDDVYYDLKVIAAASLPKKLREYEPERFDEAGTDNAVVIGAAGATSVTWGALRMAQGETDGIYALQAGAAIFADSMLRTKNAEYGERAPGIGGGFVSEAKNQWHSLRNILDGK